MITGNGKTAHCRILCCHIRYLGTDDGDAAAAAERKYSGKRFACSSAAHRNVVSYG